MAQLPSSRAVTSALRFDKGAKQHQTRTEQGDTPASGSQDELSDKGDVLNLQVRIDRSIMVNTVVREEAAGLNGQGPYWDKV